MQIKFFIGCAGWDYKDWVGPFYPKTLESSHHLEHYVKYFDIVEINSTFYNLPSFEIVSGWVKRVPKDFKFIVKAWQKMTHNLNDPDLEIYINQFFSRMEPLREKISRLLFQFPPWFKYSEKHLKQLNILIKKVPIDYKYIIELRDNSWFNPGILFNLIDGYRGILGTTYMPDLIPFYMSNQKSYYIRLIGDRELTVFNRIQRTQEEALNNLNQNIDILQKSPNIHEIFIIVNNHFAGFAPESANELKKRFGLPIKQFNQQKKIFDFI
ncbi:MAG: DUF72 domain-containing protein [Promethearchaeota archaeon]|nr:MAG: DUF72 domain-containing protein [Candidatus Lokiarchaeota archaeon]